MAEKKTNEILEEQRRARQEFLDLKKMQQGEMEAPPKPSEVAMPKKVLTRAKMSTTSPTRPLMRLRRRG